MGFFFLGATREDWMGTATAVVKDVVEVDEKWLEDEVDAMWLEDDPDGEARKAEEVATGVTRVMEEVSADRAATEGRTVTEEAEEVVAEDEEEEELLTVLERSVDDEVAMDVEVA